MTGSEDAFHALVHKQKDTARNARKVAGTEGWKSAGVIAVDAAETRFTGYTGTETEAKVIAILNKDGAPVEQAAEGESVILVLDATPFYPGGGGQAPDTGVITGDGFEFTVAEVT